MAVSKKGNRTQAKQVSTGLARREANTPTSDKPSAESPKPTHHRLRCQQAFATTDVTLITYLSLQAMSAAGGKLVKDDFTSDYAFAAVHSLGARDGLEALLAVQMVGVHSLAMKFLATAALKDQTDYGVEASINRANRLLRTFATQVEALKKYRSKGEQHCTVEHVHVHSGGQAVVGAVTATGQGRGEGNKGNGDQ